MSEIAPRDATVPLVQVTRGGVVESVHRGVAVIAAADGRIVEAWGEPTLRVVLRSAAKLFQVGWFVASGAAEKIGATAEDIAIAAGSHGGAPEHVAAVRALLERGGVAESELRCGVHPPFDAGARLALRGAPPSVLHNNCSGKHAAMLAGARALGQDAAGYLAPEHPWQRGILELLADAARIPAREIGTVTDGCSAPSFVLPAAAAARAFARLAAADDGPLARVFRDCAAHPLLIAGEGRVETELMRARPGEVVAKGGAEGVMALALRPASGERLGVIVKIEDGDGQRARQAVALRIAERRLGLDAARMRELRRSFTPPVLTLLGERVGEVTALL